MYRADMGSGEPTDGTCQHHSRTIAPRRIVIATLLLTGSGGAALAAEPTTLLNASYDVSRELYKDINAAFIADWKKKTGETSSSTNRTAARPSRRWPSPTASKPTS